MGGVSNDLNDLRNWLNEDTSELASSEEFTPVAFTEEDNLIINAPEHLTLELTDDITAKWIQMTNKTYGVTINAAATDPAPRFLLKGYFKDAKYHVLSSNCRKEDSYFNADISFLSSGDCCIKMAPGGLWLNGVLSETIEGTKVSFERTDPDNEGYIMRDNRWSGRTLLSMGVWHVPRLGNIGEVSPLGTFDTVHVGTTGSRYCRLVYEGPGEVTDKTYNFYGGSGGKAFIIGENATGPVEFTGDVNFMAYNAFGFRGSYNGTNIIHSSLSNGLTEASNVTAMSFSVNGQSSAPAESEWLFTGDNSFSGEFKIIYGGAAYFIGDNTAVTNKWTIDTAGTAGGRTTVGSALINVKGTLLAGFPDGEFHALKDVTINSSSTLRCGAGGSLVVDGILTLPKKWNLELEAGYVPGGKTVLVRAANYSFTTDSLPLPTIDVGGSADTLAVENLSIVQDGDALVLMGAHVPTSALLSTLITIR